MAEKGIWNYQAVAAGIGAVVTFALGKLDTIKTDWAWNWIPGWLSAVSNWFTKPSIQPMSVFLAVFALIIARRIFLAAKHAVDDQTAAPPFIHYTTDRIDGLQWRWRWAKSTGGRFNVTDIQARCPKCDYPMVWTRSGYYAFGYNCVYCEECKHHQQLESEQKDVENRIRRRIGHAIESNTVPNPSA